MIIKTITVPKYPLDMYAEEKHYDLAIPIEVPDNIKGTELTLAVILALNEKLKEALEPSVIIE